VIGTSGMEHSLFCLFVNDCGRIDRFAESSVTFASYDALVNPTLTQHERMSDISHTMMIVSPVQVGGLLIGFVRTSLMNAASDRVVARLRTDLYQALFRQEIAFFDEHKTGELVPRLTSDTSLLQVGTSQVLPEVVLGVTLDFGTLGIAHGDSSKNITDERHMPIRKAKRSSMPVYKIA